MAEQTVAEALNLKADPIERNIAGEQLSLEGAVLMITTKRVGDLEAKIKEAHKEIQARQEKIAFLHGILRAINATTSDEETLDWENDPELLEMLEKAREMGIEIPEGKTKFDKNSRLRLIENIKMGVDDLNLENEMQMQTVTRLTNERYESYQMARSIMKPLHELRMAILRNFKGR